jgi:hypothetical protein
MTFRHAKRPCGSPLQGVQISAQKVNALGLGYQKGDFDFWVIFGFGNGGSKPIAPLPMNRFRPSARRNDRTEIGFIVLKFELKKLKN